MESRITHSGNSTFFVNNALHYLCRPSCLEQLSVDEFFSGYEVINATKANKDSLMPFVHTDEFIHPSFNRHTGEYKQGVRKRCIPKLSKILERDFPDPSTFEGNILSNLKTRLLLLQT